jgi:hypothetical protein
VWVKTPSAGSVNVSEVYSFDVDAEDPDVGDTLTYSISADKITTVSIDSSTGIISWTPSGTGIYTFTVTVSDGEDSEEHIFMMSVLAKNTLPTVTLDTPDNGAEVMVTNPTLSWVGEDRDGDALRYSVYLSKTYTDISGLSSSARIATDLSNSFFSTSNLEQGSTYYWIVIPNDLTSAGTCLSGIWSFRVSANATFNNPPEFLSIPPEYATINMLLEYEPYAFDRDENDTVTIVFDPVNGPQGMTFIDGILKWTPTQEGMFYVRIGATDGKDWGYQAFYISVTPTKHNQPPTLDDPPEDQGWKEGDTITIELNVSDPEGGALSFYFDEQFPPPEGVEIDEHTGVITWETGKGDAGKHLISVIAEDEQGNKKYVPVTITIEEDEDDGGIFAEIDWWELMGIIIGLITVLIGLMFGAVLARRKFNRLRRIMDEVDWIYEDNHEKPTKCRKMLTEKRKEVAGLLKNGKISREDFLVARNHIDDYIDDLKKGRKKKKAQKAKTAKIAGDLEVFDAEIVDSEGFAEVETKKTEKALGVATKMGAAGASVKLGGWDLTDDLPPEIDSDMPATWGGEDEEGIAGEIDVAEFDPYRDDLGEGADRPFLALPPATVFEANFEDSDLPKVDEVFIMTADGLLIQHFSYKDTSMVDEDILASMLTVVQQFIQDSFGGSGGLKKLELGNFTILIEKGEYLSVVVISPEKEVEPLMKPISMMVMHIEQMNADVLKDWNGDQGAFQGMDDAVGKLVEGKY